MQASSLRFFLARLHPGLRAAVPAAAVAAVLGLGAVRSEANETFISFGRQAAQPDTESLGGNTVTINDVVDVDTGDLLFSRLSELGLAGDLDGYHQLPNGNVLFSSEPYVFGVAGVGFIHPGDVIEYDVDSDSFSVFFNNNNFVGLANVDGVSIAPSGNLLLSTKGRGNLPGLGVFQDGDVVEWDGAAASLYLAEGDIFTSGANNDVDAIHSVDESGIIISPRTDGGGGLGSNGLAYGFDSSDLFQIDLGTGEASRVLDGENLWDSGNTRQTDAVFVSSSAAECSCFDADFLANEVMNPVCRVRQSPTGLTGTAHGVDEDGCRGNVRVTFQFATQMGSCLANSFEDFGFGCINTAPSTGGIFSVEEFEACAALIEDHCQ